MVPWNECDRCFIGPSVLNFGDRIEVSIGFFFVEIGVELKRRGKDGRLSKS
jgi:hypothetical protein